MAGRIEGMGYIGVYLIIGLLVAGGSYLILPRSVCLGLGGIALVLGVAAPLAIWGYAKMFVTGDPSAYGMLGTLLVILFAPAGIALVLLGLIKGE